MKYKPVLLFFLIIVLVSSLAVFSACPQPAEEAVIFDGFEVTPIGDAKLEIVDGNLVVSNIGPEGNDGVQVNLEGYNVWNWEIENPDKDNDVLPIGSEIIVELYDESGEMVKGTRQQKIEYESGHAWEYYMTFEGESYMAEVYSRGDELVFRQEIFNEGDGGYIPFASVPFPEGQRPGAFDGHAILYTSSQPFPWSPGACVSNPFNGAVEGIMLYGDGFVSAWGHLVLCSGPPAEAELMADSNSFGRADIIGIFPSEGVAEGERWDSLTITSLSGEKNNSAPDPVEIDGPASGKVGEECEYVISATDTDNDDVYYYIDWGDGSDISHIGPYTSGEPVTASHTWAKEGTYTIMVQAKDINRLLSGWSTLTLNISPT